MPKRFLPCTGCGATPKMMSAKAAYERGVRGRIVKCVCGKSRYGRTESQAANVWNADNARPDPVRVEL